MKAKLAVCLLLLTATGCRLYGGRGGADAVGEKIGAAAEQSLTNYDRARRDRDVLMRAAEEDASIAAFAERHAAIVERHAGVVEKHLVAARDADGTGNVLFRWVGPDRYRRLHREYGALISERQVIEDSYAALARDLQRHFDMSAAPEAGDRFENAPHFYRRTATARSISDILRARTQ